MDAGPTTKDQLLDTGKRLFLDRGFTGTGLRDLLAETGIPKGSFYHHFSSKEDFGLRVVESAAADGYELLDARLSEQGVAHLERLRGFFEDLVHNLALEKCRGGCLMGTLGQELANVREPMRRRIEALSRKWVSRVAKCLSQARKEGELSSDVDPKGTAEFLFLAWEGALQQMRIRHHRAPLDAFLTVTFEQLLRPA